jgi:endoglucanase
LNSANIAGAAGFAINVSNFKTDADNQVYGDAVSAKTGNKHYVVDTSRNGNGPGDTWCNPAGRALGQKPTLGSGNLDAYIWVKYPGQSDGTCNGGPSAGTWWPDYALGLAQRAAY